MECSCGGYTTVHEVVRDTTLVGEFSQCVACGRVLWIFGQEAARTIDAKRALQRSGQQTLEL